MTWRFCSSGRGATVTAVALALVGSSSCGIVSGGSTPRNGGAASVSDAVVATIPLSDYGTDVAVQAGGTRVYVPARTGKVLVIDVASRSVAETIATNGQPYAIALTADGARAYVTDLTAQDVLALDTVHNRLLKSIAVGTIERPVLAPAVAVSRDGTRAYVTNATAVDDHLLVIDTASNAIVGDHFLKIHPAAVAVSPDGRLVYVAGCKLACIDGTFLVIDAATASVVSTIPLASAPTALALAPDGSRAYVANGRAATAAVIDLATTAVTTIPVGADPAGVAIDPHGAFLYVTSLATASVSVIDTRSSVVVATVAVAKMPRAIAVSPDGRFAYLTHGSRICSVIDLQRTRGGSGT